MRQRIIGCDGRGAASDRVRRAVCVEDWRWMAPLLALHLSLTLPLARLLNVWIDEASSLETSGQGLRRAVGQAISYELQAPLYFALLDLWRALDRSIFHARLFSALCVALTLVALVGVARRYLPAAHPGWVVAAVAFNPFAVWAATEIRVYALALLLSAALLLLFYDGYLAGRSRRARWGHAAVALLALYAYYYLGFLLLAQACALLALRRWRPLRSFCALMAVVGAGFAPLLARVPGQARGYTSALAHAPTLGGGLRTLSWRLQEQLVPAAWEPLRPWGRIALAGLCLAALALLLKRPARLLTREHCALWVMAAVSALCLLAASLATTDAFLESRHTTVFFIPATCSAFAALAPVARGRGVAAWAAAVIAFSLASDGALYSRPARTGDWRRVAACLAAAEAPGQPILVFQPISAVALSYHYSGVNRLVPVPQADDFRTFNGPDGVLKDEAQLESLLAQTPGGEGRVWLVTDDNCRNLGRDFNCQVLESFVAARYEVEMSRSFTGSRVRLLRRRHTP